jgi:16S rRNA (cytosine1402-N4)-methyltransferase
MTQRGDSVRPYHEPVMVDEVLEWLEPAGSGWIVDGTFGGGGHTRELLRRHPRARVIGIDRDPDAVRQAPHEPRLVVVEANHRDLRAVLRDERFPDRVDGILLDLGVSSHQLDEPSRGFSYHTAGPLDMRMGPDAPQTVGELIDDVTVDELTAILRRYGDERYARRIASAIVRERPFGSTRDLAQTIADAVPAAARRDRHPARRSFQALRIAVNDELAGLADALDAAIDLLNPGGRLVVIAYHSLEDRIVKRLFADRSTECSCPPDLPACVCGASPDVVVLTRKPIRPSRAEVERNPRSRSAVLRVAEKRGDA